MPFNNICLRGEVTGDYGVLNLSSMNLIPILALPKSLFRATRKGEEP